MDKIKSKERERKKETKSKSEKSRRNAEREGLTSGDYSNRIMAQRENGE